MYCCRYAIRQNCIKIIAVFFATFFSLDIYADISAKVQQLQNSLEPHEQLAVYTPEGNALFRHGEGVFIPASILKIMTSLAAIDLLGEDYRFVTNLYTRSYVDNSVTVDMAVDLVIQGAGDPVFVSEQIDVLAQQLVNRGKTNFSRLTLDNSLIEWTLAPGSHNSINPYDAPNGAFIVNFNTIYLNKSKAGVISSGEKQTPLTPLARDFGRNMAHASIERFNLGDNQQISLRYSHELLQAIFASYDIHFADTSFYAVYSHNRPPEKYTNLLLRFSNSESLYNILTNLLQHSNNYIANQIGLVIALEHNISIPVNLASALTLVDTHIKSRLDIDKHDAFYFDEFSGISRQNRIDIDVMHNLLMVFSPYAQLLPEYQKNIRAKTGTLQGIRNLAGYIVTSDGQYPFIIHTNNAQKRDLLLSLLQSVVQTHES